MKLNGIKTTFALVASALFIIGSSAQAGEPSDGNESIPPLTSPSDVVEVSEVQFTAAPPARGYTGRAFTPNRPVSPKAPRIVSLNPVAANNTTQQVASAAPRGYTAHSPVSPAAPAPRTVSTPDVLVASNN